MSAAALTDLRWTIADGIAVARRNLAHVRVVPEKLLDVTVQPLLFVLLFAYVFGGSIAVPGSDYRSYVVVGIFVQTLAFAAGGTASSIADDMGNGIVERFRSLPMARSAVLVGRTVADLATSVIGLVVLTAAALIVGWGVHAGVGDAIAGFGLLLLFAFAMSWMGTVVGLLVRSPDAVMGLFFVTMFPLTFVSNAFVDTSHLPSALATVANWNPISAVTAAVRQLFGNTGAPAPSGVWPLEHPVLAAVLWCVAIVAVCAPVAVAVYRRATSR
jgi:ABC-2 type transport system permease protein